MNTNEMRVRLTFLEEVLGTSPNNPDICREYIAANNPDPTQIEEEVEAISTEEAIEKSMTVFPRTEDGKPFIYDYQIKGFFKDACGMLKRVTGTKSSKIKAYKKEIDGLIFVAERQIPFEFDGEMGECQRPLRASTPQGERVALAHSETIPAGATVEFTIQYMLDSHKAVIEEWLDYGVFRGLGQWRNASKGKFVHEILDDKGNVIGGNKK